MPNTIGHQGSHFTPDQQSLTPILGAGTPTYFQTEAFDMGIIL